MKNNNKDRLDILSTVVHELKTPVSAIKEAMSLLSEKKHKLEPEMQRIISIAQEETNRLVRMIDNLLKASLIESGKVHLQLEPVRINDVINTVLSSQELIIKQKKIHLKTQVNPSLPLIQADKDRLFEVLANLLDNALKFTPSGGTIKISAKTVSGKDKTLIKIGAVSQQKYIQVTVADTGPGIPKRDLTRIFRKFERLRTPAKVRGIGLGLNIAKNIVELHSGKIWASSELGKGAQFHFILPIK
ncbi:MAG: cell wall metabolism sensor histidine kinase WalK [candidate division WOR-3 bacterium]|nr:cell wall metabolism sensor histidine kinase WalK [candidate division WOR-3 bacterium]